MVSLDYDKAIDGCSGCANYYPARRRRARSFGDCLVHDAELPRRFAKASTCSTSTTRHPVPGRLRLVRHVRHRRGRRGRGSRRSRSKPIPPLLPQPLPPLAVRRSPLPTWWLARQVYENVRPRESRRILAAVGLADIYLFDSTPADARSSSWKRSPKDQVTSNEQVVHSKRSALAIAYVKQRRPRNLATLRGLDREHPNQRGIRSHSDSLLRESSVPNSTKISTSSTSSSQPQSRTHTKIIERHASTTQEAHHQCHGHTSRPRSRYSDLWLESLRAWRGLFAATTQPRRESEFEACVKRRREVMAPVPRRQPTYRCCAPDPPRLLAAKPPTRRRAVRRRPTGTAPHSFEHRPGFLQIPGRRCAYSST